MAVVTDGTEVYAMLGTGLRCVKVLKKNEKRFMLEKYQLDSLDGLQRGVMTGGSTVG